MSIAPRFKAGDTYSYESVTQPRVTVTWTRDEAGVWTANDSRKMKASDQMVTSAYKYGGILGFAQPKEQRPKSDFIEVRRDDIELVIQAFNGQRSIPGLAKALSRLSKAAFEEEEV